MIVKSSRGFWLAFQTCICLVFISFLKVQNALATMTITATGASTAIVPLGQTAVIYYYSNIAASNPQSNGSVAYWADGGGTGCPNARNPYCLNNTSLLTLQASSDQQKTGSGTMYVIVADHAISNSNPNDTGKSLSSIGPPSPTLTSQIYTAGQAGITPFSPSFANICLGYTAPQPTNPWNPAGTTRNIMPNCTLGSGTPGNATSGSAVGAVIYINFILETQNSTILDPNSDVGSIQLVVDSAIPAVSSIASQVGFYQWLAYPGDSEIHIKNIQTDTAFPSTENSGLVGVNNVLFYYNTTGFPSTDPTTSGEAVFPISVMNNTGALSSYYVTGLTNGVTYYLTSALQDYAGNIGFDTASTDNAGHSVAPSQIAGLLTKNGECFIATAAYGTPMARQVEILRNFRDRYLMKTQNGRNFVSWYYKHSPPFAAKLARNDTARLFVRWLLYPLIAFSWLALKWGGANACLFTCTLILLPLLIYRHKKNRPFRIRKA